MSQCTPSTAIKNIKTKTNKKDWNDSYIPSGFTCVCHVASEDGRLEMGG
jgi:hypothetical protein